MSKVEVSEVLLVDKYLDRPCLGSKDGKSSTTRFGLLSPRLFGYVVERRVSATNWHVIIFYTETSSFI